MDFSLTDEQIMFRNMAREFATRHIEPVAKDNDLTRHFPEEIIKEMAKLGLLGATVPQQYGGLEVDNICYAVIVEEIARVCGSVAVSGFSCHSAVQEALAVWGSEEQKQQYLPAMCSGEMPGCYAVIDLSGADDLAAIDIKATANGDKWILNGTKAAVSNGSQSQLALVIAQTDEEKGAQGLAAFLISQDTPGFSSMNGHDTMGLRASNTADIVLEECAISKDSLLGKVGDGSEIVDTILGNSLYSLSACYVGIAQACINASLDYAQQRQQFGQPIARFNMVQEMIAEMIADTEASRLLVHRVGDLKNRGLGFASELHIAKYHASKAVLKAATDAVQVFGGYGYTMDYPVERFLRDAATATVWEGTPNEHKLAAARYALEI